MPLIHDLRWHPDRRVRVTSLFKTKIPARIRERRHHHADQLPPCPPPSPSWNGLRPDHLSPLNATTTTTNAAGKEDQPPDAAGRRWGERERERDLESERERTKKIGGGRKLLQQRPYLTLEGRNNNSSSSSDDVPPLPAAAPRNLYQLLSQIALFYLSISNSSRNSRSNPGETPQKSQFVTFWY